MHDRSRSSKLREAVEAHLADGRGQVVHIERKFFCDTDGMAFLKNDELCVLTALFFIASGIGRKRGRVASLCLGRYKIRLYYCNTLSG